MKLYSWENHRTIWWIFQSAVFDHPTQTSKFIKIPLEIPGNLPGNTSIHRTLGHQHLAAQLIRHHAFVRAVRMVHQLLRLSGVHLQETHLAEPPMAGQGPRGSWVGWRSM